MYYRTLKKIWDISENGSITLIAKGEAETLLYQA